MCHLADMQTPQAATGRKVAGVRRGLSSRSAEGGCALGLRKGRSDWASLLELPPSRHNDLIRNLSVYNPCAPSPTPLGLLPLPQPHSPQLHLLVFPSFPYSQQHKNKLRQAFHMWSAMLGPCVSTNLQRAKHWPAENQDQLRFPLMKHTNFPNTVTILPFSSSLLWLELFFFTLLVSASVVVFYFFTSLICLLK